MKKQLFVLLILTTSMCYSQKITKSVGDSICLCLEAKLPNTDRQYLRDTISGCVGSGMAPHTEELFEAYDLESYTVENIRYVQKKLFARLEKKCEVFKDLKK